jgi:hypothetical protein
MSEVFEKEPCGVGCSCKCVSQTAVPPGYTAALISGYSGYKSENKVGVKFVTNDNGSWSIVSIYG